MPEKSFDIKHFLNFEPPQYICLKCKALLYELEEVKNTGNIGYRCPICKMIYLKNELYGHYWEFFADNVHQINLGDKAVEHCKSLASIAITAKEYLLKPKEEDDYSEPYPPMRAFLEAIQEAKEFIHFVSFGLSPSILGALKATATKVPIRGIVSSVSETRKQEIEKSFHESPGLQIKTFPKYDRNAPHQKLVIVDGLLAFTGSVNLTDNGFRNAEEGRDIIEYITDIEKIVSLNNNHFSPIWSKFCEIDKINMEKYSFLEFDPLY